MQHATARTQIPKAMRQLRLARGGSRGPALSDAARMAALNTACTATAAPESAVGASCASGLCRYALNAAVSAGNGPSAAAAGHERLPSCHLTKGISQAYHCVVDHTM